MDKRLGGPQSRSGRGGSKGKSKVVPVLKQAPRHENVLGNGGIAPRLLTSTLGGGEWSASSPRRFIRGERAPGTHWIERWVGPRAGLDVAEKRKNPSPRRESNPLTPIVQRVPGRYTD
jgi:hypothetical protein